MEKNKSIGSWFSKTIEELKKKELYKVIEYLIKELEREKVK